jgi:hypothetical protein
MSTWTEIWTSTDRYVFEDGLVYKSNKDIFGAASSVQIGQARTVADAIAIVKSRSGKAVTSVNTKTE